jgi:Protein of unknown function (DUF2637)
MTSADKAIRWSTIAAVVVVAAVAAAFSYVHALDVITAHSRPSRLNLVAPLCIDGVVYSSSMVLLNDARRGLRPHWLAYTALGLGISATLAVNVAAGLAFGPVGAIVAAWPAPALVISYELLMLIVRRSARTAPVPAAAHLNGHGAPASGREAAELYAAELARGELQTVRRIQREMHLGAPRARQVVSYLSVLART